MLKILIELALLSVVVKAIVGRWPWEMLRMPARSADVAAVRALLGVSPGAGHGEIIDAHRRLIVRVHPDRGGTEALVHEANDARDLLLAALAAAKKE